MKRALIAMSGGVDSSVAAYLIQKQGCDTCGATLKLYDENGCGTAVNQSCCSDRDIEDARRVAASLGIDYRVLSHRENFRENVIEPFVNGYLRGETPNPCVDCNRTVKFRILIDYADANAIDYVVTGHYARVEEDRANGRFLLKKGLDHNKDQSYVLYTLSQHQLSKVLLPIGEMSKQEVRDIAKACRFPVFDKPDSQDICFIKDGDYVSFIEKWCGKKFEPGSFVDTSGRVIAKHQGIIRYTVGQRRGLGIASAEPYFVLKKDVPNNTVIIGREQEQYTDTLIAKDLNFIAFDSLNSPIHAKVKIRYKHKEAPASITPLENGRALVEFEQPQRAVTSGQSVVFYEDEYVIGGGKIE